MLKNPFPRESFREGCEGEGLGPSCLPAPPAGGLLWSNLYYLTEKDSGSQSHQLGIMTTRTLVGDFKFQKASCPSFLPRWPASL